MMSLDDRAADRETNAHTPTLSCIEGIKKLAHVLRVNSHPGVPHGHAHTVAVISFGSDQQCSRAVVKPHHRIGGVPDQVQDDLLELHTIAINEREVIGEFRPQITRFR